jgi:NitT/TauT family transport system substrate-binding protein
MMVAQGMAEKDPDSALKDTVGTYYKTTLEAAKLAASKQPVMIDQRNNTQFIIDRSQSMKELGYVKKLAPRQAIDWTLLEQVVAENKALYDGLKLTSTKV